MNYKVEKNVITVGKKSVEFPFKISHSEQFGDVIIVITDYYTSDINENVWGINGRGEIIWQIPKVNEVSYDGQVYTGITDPYTGVHKVDDQTARLFNWEGGYFEINPLSGKFTKNIMEFRKGKRSW